MAFGGWLQLAVTLNNSDLSPTHGRWIFHLMDTLLELSDIHLTWGAELDYLGTVCPFFFGGFG